MLGERICLLRRRRGWSQAELASQLCISASTVGMYEQGRREPSLEGAVKMSRVFGVSVDYLLTGRPLTDTDLAAVREAVERSLPESYQGQSGRFSREELAVLYAAILTEA